MPFLSKFRWAFSLLAFGLLFCLSTTGQSLKRQTLGATGGSVSGDGVTLQYTAGQPSGTASVYDVNSGLRGGFQQPIYSALLKRINVLTLELYPNPTLAVVHVTTPLTIGDQLIVYDSKGILLLEKNIVSDFNQFTIDFQNLPPATYFIHLVRSQNLVATSKIVKQ